jgi:hypothetical protein
MTTTYVQSVDELNGMLGGIVDEFYGVTYDPVLKQAQEDIDDLHSIYFASEMAPNNAIWPENAPATIRRKKHDRVLIDSGKLRKSLTDPTAEDAVREIIHEHRNHGLVHGTDRPYSIYHQEAIGQKLRQHVGLTEQYLDELCEQVADHTVKALTK